MLTLSTLPATNFDGDDGGLKGEEGKGGEKNKKGLLKQRHGAAELLTT